MVIQLLDAGGFDVVILDGESTPVGGLGIAKQLQDEITDCPPVLVLTGRADDAWLASWSRAEAHASTRSIRSASARPFSHCWPSP